VQNGGLIPDSSTAGTEVWVRDHTKHSELSTVCKMKSENHLFSPFYSQILVALLIYPTFYSPHKGRKIIL
jgi:hypothetical protein